VEKDLTKKKEKETTLERGGQKQVGSPEKTLEVEREKEW